MRSWQGLQPRAVPTPPCGGPACFWLQQEPQALHRFLHPPASQALLLPAEVRSGRLSASHLVSYFLPTASHPLRTQNDTEAAGWQAQHGLRAPVPREQKEK